MLAAGLGGLRRDLRARRAARRYPIPVRLELDVPDKADLAGVLALQVRSSSGARVPLSEIAVVEERPVGRRRSTTRTCCRSPASPPTRSATSTARSTACSSIVGARRRRDLPAGIELEQRFFSAPEDPVPLHAQVGRRVADHLRDLPRHGPRLLGRPDPDLPAGGRAVPLLRRAARDHGADPAHDHRRDAGACAARRAVHRHLDDRHDRARRHHRAQLDPAGGLHQRRDRAGPQPRRRRDPRRRGARPARSRSPAWRR